MFPASSTTSKWMVTQPEGMAFLRPTTGAGRARGRSTLGRRFAGGEGRRQHRFGVARPLVQLCLGGTLQRWRELFHIPYFRHPRAGPTGLQAVGPAHIRAFVGARHECKAPAALGGPIVTDVAIAHLATA